MQRTGSSAGSSTAPPSGAGERLSELRELFRQFGFRPSRRRGQNFLIDDNLRRLLVERARLDAKTCVLEVGAGTGTLTALLAQSARKVWAVEIDRILYRIASAVLDAVSNVELISRDILSSKSQLDRGLEERILAYLEEHPEAQLKVMGNLPYAIATPLIVVLLEGPLPVRQMVFCVQRELAERLVATRGKSYGAVSVRVQANARVQVFRRLPRQVFWPAPKVESCFVAIEPDAALREQIRSYAHFSQLVDRLFRHRRKRISTIVKSLTAAERLELALDIDDIPHGNKRPDELAPEDFITFSNKLVSNQRGPSD